MKKWKKHLNAARKFGKKSCCEGKIRHQTYSKAAVAAESATKKYSRAKAPYPCPFCDGWHVGRLLSREELNS